MMKKSKSVRRAKETISVIIPVGTENSGLGDEYFHTNHINLLPLAHKTLIEYILDDLIKIQKSFKFHLNVFIVGPDSQKENYDSIIKSRFGNISSFKIEYVDIYPYEKKGIPHIVQKIYQHYPSTDDIMLFYGDSLFHDLFLFSFIKEHILIKNKGKDFLVMGISKLPNGNEEVEEHINRFGGKPSMIMCKKADYERRTITWKNEDKNYFVISQDKIVDVCRFIPQPLDINNKNSDMFFMMGLLSFNKKFWEKACESAHQSLSIADIVRGISIKKYTKISVSCVVNDKGTENWLDINTPWAYLMANNYLLYRLLKGQGQTNSNFGRLFERQPDLQNSKYRIFCNNTIPENRKLAIPKRCQDITIPDLIDEANIIHYFDEYDSDMNEKNNRINGISDMAVLDGVIVAERDFNIRIEAGAIIHGVCVIKRGAVIKENAFISNSIIGENAYVGPFSFIDHSVIGKDSRIYSRCTVPYSIIGENVVVGGSTAIACEGLFQNESISYLANEEIIRYNYRLGAIIGDDCKIGMACYLNPGKKIGRKCTIYPHSYIRDNTPRETTIKPERRDF